MTLLTTTDGVTRGILGHRALNSSSRARGWLSRGIVGFVGSAIGHFSFPAVDLCSWLLPFLFCINMVLPTAAVAAEPQPPPLTRESVVVPGIKEPLGCEIVCRGKSLAQPSPDAYVSRTVVQSSLSLWLCAGAIFVTTRD